MINSVVLVGRLTKDPELRYSASNVPMVYFTLAVNRNFVDQNGQKGADFVSCVVFRKLAENLVKYQHKGSLIGVVGRIATRNFQNNTGGTTYVTEVVADSIQFLESKKKSDDVFNPFLENNYDFSWE